MGEMAEYYSVYGPYSEVGEPGETDEFEGVAVIRTTEKAILCAIDGAEHWIPRSQIIDSNPVIDGRLVIPAWLAKKKGLAT